MRRYGIWVLSVLLLAGVLGFAFVNLPTQFAAVKDWKKFSMKSKAAAEAKREVIRQELGSLKTHLWAGEYYYGDGLGVNVDLSLAPKSGFVFTWNGCLGLYDQNYGDVAESDGRIRLVFKLSNERKGFQGIAPEFFPVIWGDRHYLISSDGVVEFANAINAGFEPRDSAWGEFLIKREDVSKAVTGFPNLPAQYSGYLLSNPIDAEISEVRQSRREDSQGITTVLLNVGATQGVKKGMEFYLHIPSGFFESAKVTRVDSSSSEAEIFQCCGDKAGPPSVGWKLSTSDTIRKAESRKK